MPKFWAFYCLRIFFDRPSARCYHTAARKPFRPATEARREGINRRMRKRAVILWVLYAFGSALFAGLTAILAKCGIKKTDSDAATAIRTVVVLAFSWLMVGIVGSAPTITTLSAKTWVFLILSGCATGASWLCYDKALQDGLASVVVPIDKLSILVSVGFSALVFKERLSGKAALGLLLIVAGTLLMLV